MILAPGPMETSMFEAVNPWPFLAFMALFTGLRLARRARLGRRLVGLWRRD